MDHIKIIAGQAYSINVYKNIRTKIMKCCANIYFNQQCLRRKIIPKYANLNVPNTSPAAQMTKKKIHITRMKGIVVFLEGLIVVRNHFVLRLILEVNAFT